MHPRAFGGGGAKISGSLQAGLSCTILRLPIQLKQNKFRTRPQSIPIMPGTKRKAQNALSGPSTKRGTGTRNVEDAEAIETAGMMERAMEDDMIDDDDDDDDMSDEDEEEDGMNEDDEQDNDDEDGADDEDVVFGQNDGDDLDDGETYGGFQDLEDGESADDDAIDSGDEQKDEGKASKGKSSSSKSQATTREKKKPNTKSLFKPVTNEEMTTLRNEGEIRGGTFEFGMKVCDKASRTGGKAFD